MDHQELYQKSIRIIESYQSQFGSFIASPNFETYAYSWLRDGSYITVAMDHVGNHDLSLAFHRWVDQVLKRYQDKIRQIEKSLNEKIVLDDKDFLFTRYSLEGFEDRSDETWGNFQYDGYGTWLWALEEHFRFTQDQNLIREVWQSVKDVCEYLVLVWNLPCYDCWEEHPDLIHPYSLACVYGGLNSALRLAEACDLPINADLYAQEIALIKQTIFEKGVNRGHFIKHIQTVSDSEQADQTSVDSSLLGLIIPYRLVDIGSDLVIETVSEIRKLLLSKSGGVYRYLNDTYYGGGTWILLTAWLGWVEIALGEIELAQKRLDWIAERADQKGWLSEQLTDEALYPDMKLHWMKKWGSVASPLLWSHAMYLILYEAIKTQKGKAKNG